MEFHQKSNKLPKDILGAFIPQITLKYNSNNSKTLNKLVYDGQIDCFELSMKHEKVILFYRNRPHHSMPIQLILDSYDLNLNSLNKSWGNTCNKYGDIIKFCYSINTNSIIIYYRTNRDETFLEAVNILDLKIICTKPLNIDTGLQIASNDSNIFLLSSNNKVHLFDWNLNLIKDFGPSIFGISTVPDYFDRFESANIRSLLSIGSRLYFLYWDRLDVVDLKTRRQIKSIEIDANRLKIGSNGNLLFWSKTQNKIFRYSKELYFIESIDVNADIIDFIVFDNGNFGFLKRPN